MHIKTLSLTLSMAAILAACGGGGGSTASNSTDTNEAAKTSTKSLSVTVSGSGSVVSSPSGINCTTGTCSKSFTTNSSVTLTATPSSGFSFTGWSGSCTGKALTCSLTMSAAKSTTATFTAAPAPTPTPTSTPVASANGTDPLVLYTDINSGPTTGGENGKGIYLSIFGKNFGSSGLGTTVKVYINNVEVDNYRSLGVSKARPDIDQVTVQVGALGSPTPGVALPIKVVVNGVASNTDQTFKVNPGKILFVDNVGGNDSTATANDITKPYRYVQTSSLAGAWGQAQPGDFIVMRGHGSTTPWTDIGYESYFFKAFGKAGTASTGSSGSGPITIMGYPTEDVYIRGTLANGMVNGCMSGVNGINYPSYGKYINITNLRLDCEGYDGPVSQQIYGHNWRIVNNDLSASTAPRTGGSVPRMAGITGNGNNSYWMGNKIHDIQGSSEECHGLYIDGDGSYEIAYNNIFNIRDGNGFQAYANGGNGSDVINNVNLHHNWIHDVSKHGVNIADGSKSNFNVWSNVIYNVAKAGVRFNTVDLVNARIMHNTFYNLNTTNNSNYGALTNDWGLPSGSLDVENNIFYVASGTPYNAGSVGIDSTQGTFAHNLWFNSSDSYSFDSTGLSANPKFVSNGVDFHLQSTSPAIAAGSSSTSVTSLVTNDYSLNPWSTRDLGAFRY